MERRKGGKEEDLGGLGFPHVRTGLGFAEEEEKKERGKRGIGRSILFRCLLKKGPGLGLSCDGCFIGVGVNAFWCGLRAARGYGCGRVCEVYIEALK